MSSALAPARSSNRWPFVFLGAALLIGAALRFWQLTTKSLFLDEGFSIALGGTPLAGLFRRIAYGDFHPPLFYLYAHAAIALLHWPREDLRWLTAPMGLVTILATWAIARRAFGDTVAAIAALLVAAEPALVSFDRLFRMYAPLVALSTASWWALVVAVESVGAKRRAAWIVYGILAVAMPYTHYLGWFVVASQIVYAATRVRRGWPGLVVAAIAVFAFIPWLWALRIQLPNGGLVGRLGGEHFYWPGVAVAVLSGGGLPLDSLTAPSWEYFAISAAVLAVIVAGAIIGRKTVLPYWLLPIAMQAAVTSLTDKNVGALRYLLHLIPAVECAFAVVSAALLQTKARLAGVGLLLAIACVDALALFNLLTVPQYQTSDWYAVDLLLASHERKGDVLIFDQGMPFFIMHAYASVHGHHAYPMTMNSGLDNAIAYVESWRNRRVWYVENQSYAPDPERRIFRHLRATRPVLGMWLQAHVDPASTVYVVLFGPEKRMRAH